MLETPSVSVPIPTLSKSVPLFMNFRETICSCNTFDPGSSPPQDSGFLKKLTKRIDSYDVSSTRERKYGH